MQPFSHFNTEILTLFNLISLYFLLTVGLCETLTKQSKLHLLFLFSSTSSIGLATDHLRSSQRRLLLPPITFGQAKGDCSCHPSPSVKPKAKGSNFFTADVVGDARREFFFYSKSGRTFFFLLQLGTISYRFFCLA